MTNIPLQTARDFDRWLTEQDQSTWPEELKVAAARALLTLKTMNQKAFAQSEALQRLSKEDLTAFAAAYAEWRK